MTIFFVLTLVGLFSISTLNAAIKDDYINNEFISNDCIGFNFETLNTLTSKNLYDTLINEEGVLLKKDNMDMGSYSGSAIYFNNLKEKLPTYKGRFFNNDDVKSNKPLMLIGKSMEDKTYYKDDKQYLKYENIEFEVVGCLGYKDRSSKYDDKFMINFSYLVSTIDINQIKDDLVIDYKWKTKYKLEEFINKLKVYDKEIKYSTHEVFRVKNPLITALSDYSYIMMIIMIIILVLVLNVFTISGYWIESKKKEIGIRKALGGSNRKIMVQVLFEYEILATISFILAMIVYTIVVKTNIVENTLLFNAEVNFKIIIVTFILLLIVGLIMCIPSIIKSLKVSPSMAMKG